MRKIDKYSQTLYVDNQTGLNKVNLKETVKI